MNKKMLVLLAGAALVLGATSALAIPFSYNTRPVAITDTAGQDSLQTVINNAVGSGVINARSDQSKVGAWTTAEQNVDAYRIALVSPFGSGKLGIFSLQTGAQYTLFTATGPAIDTPAKQFTASFAIEKDDISGKNTLLINNVEKDFDFGSAFGFYWLESEANPDHYSYTLDSMNSPNSTARALSYLVPDGTDVDLHRKTTTTTTSHASGNNDWILAFDNYLSTANKFDSLTDFNDAVFYMEDMNPVPEPGTMVLLGAGLLGLAIFGKRRMNKD